MCHNIIRMCVTSLLHANLIEFSPIQETIQHNYNIWGLRQVVHLPLDVEVTNTWVIMDGVISLKSTKNKRCNGAGKC